MGVSEIQQLFGLWRDMTQLLKVSTKCLQMSACSYYSAIKLSPTIADLENSRQIKVPHIAEAL